MDHDTEILGAIGPLCTAGFAVHWLKPRGKSPIGNDWQNKPRLTAEELRASHHRGNNVGVRLGEPSHLSCGYYLHAIDFDIRHADLAEEAWDAFASILPSVNPNSLPCVASGSGGESRHLYFVTDKPFFSKKLAVSEGKHRRWDETRQKHVWSCDWEIDLFGTGKQVVLPPSIHPDTRQPYLWVREFDFDILDLGLDVPFIPSAVIEALGVAETTEYQYESREPLTFKDGQMERELGLIEVSDLHYDDWITLGAAIHHQMGGSDAGFQMWLEHTKRSTKFDGDERTMLRKWRSFGKNRRAPVTMATVREWAMDARAARFRDAFDEEDDDPAGDPFGPETVTNPPATAADDPFADLFDGTPADPFDDGLGDAATPAAPTLDWVSLLAVTKDGDAFASNLHNMELIVRNDPRLIGLPQLNEFTQETVQRVQPGQKSKKRRKSAKETRQLEGKVWEVKDTLNGEIWTSARDYAIRSILEAPQTQGGYGIKVSDRDLKAATVLSAWDNSFHPVREYLTGVKWDGVPRVERLFIDYLGAEDNSYTRSVARILMVAGVTRIFEPGAKYDFAVILEGLQGRGKSTFIRTLGKAWFAELEGDFHDDKLMVEKMQGAWIMEIPELSGFGRSDVRAIKAFISRQTDKVRLAYESRAAEFPRQCVFIGSTNDREYLKDDTGGRRFFPMACCTDMIDSHRLRKNIDLLWAEALVLYKQMRAETPFGDLPLYLVDDAAATEAARLQETRRIESSDDALVGEIAAWLDRPLISGGFDSEHDGGVRNVTCLLEIWLGLGNDRRTYNQANAQSVGRSMARIDGWHLTGRFYSFPSPIGRQRYYERLGSKGVSEPISKA